MREVLPSAISGFRPETLLFAKSGHMRACFDKKEPMSNINVMQLYHFSRAAVNVEGAAGSLPRRKTQKRK